VELELVEGRMAEMERVEEVVGVSAELLGGPFTVCYIEDNLSNVRLVERILSNQPEVKLVVAMQGRMGLDLARNDPPDLIFLDLNLPDMPGEEILRMLWEDPRTSDIPVVVISADATPARSTAYSTKGLRNT
jgi:CheY-like chemotaxis protein